jgi:hypothetical protein
MAAASTVLANTKRDWRTAFRAMKNLLADPDDTVQVFKIMQALNAGTSAKNYHRLISTHEGGRVAFAIRARHGRRCLSHVPGEDGLLRQWSRSGQQGSSCRAQ